EVSESHTPGYPLRYGSDAESLRLRGRGYSASPLPLAGEVGDPALVAGEPGEGHGPRATATVGAAHNRFGACPHPKSLRDFDLLLRYASRPYAVATDPAPRARLANPILRGTPLDMGA